MTSSQHSSRSFSRKRRYVLYIGSVFLLYPLLRFLGFTVPKKPKVLEISKSIPVGGYLVQRDFVLFDKKGKCWALSRTCTHLGCKLTYQEKHDILECPCHQSQFHATTGEVLKGPAQKPLHFFEVKKKEGGQGYVVTT